MEELNIGKRIKEERDKLGISQSALGEKIGLSGAHVGLIERGERGVTSANLAKLSKIFNVTIDELFISDKDMSDEMLERKICNDIVKLARRDKQIVIEVIKALKSIEESIEQ